MKIQFYGPQKNPITDVGQGSTYASEISYRLKKLDVDLFIHLMLTL